MFKNFALMDDAELTAYFTDAQQAIGFITPQQLRIEAQVYEMRYPAFDYAALLPVNTDGDMWEAGTIYFSGDIAGKAEWFSGRADDFPFADVAFESFERANHMAAIGYEWSTGEVIRAARSGRNLTADKANAARRVGEQFIYNVAVSGSAEKNFTGLINNAAVPSAALGAAWTGATTPETILSDVNGVLMAPGIATRDVYQADVLLLPPSVIQYLAGRLIANTTTTLLDFIRQQNGLTTVTGRPLTIRALYELETAGAGNTRRMMAYARDPNVAQFHLPGPHTFLPPYQRSALSYEVAGIMNIGGTEFRIPLGAAYRDGL
jgi:hypothetical protein